jgi:hypothetical protein
MQIATYDRQQTKAPASARSLGISTKNRTGESRRDTSSLDTEKGYTFLIDPSP